MSISNQTDSTESSIMADISSNNSCPFSKPLVYEKCTTDQETREEMELSISEHKVYKISPYDNCWGYVLDTEEELRFINSNILKGFTFKDMQRLKEKNRFEEHNCDSCGQESIIISLTEELIAELEREDAGVLEKEQELKERQALNALKEKVFNETHRILEEKRNHIMNGIRKELTIEETVVTSTKKQKPLGKDLQSIAYSNASTGTKQDQNPRPNQEKIDDTRRVTKWGNTAIKILKRYEIESPKRLELQKELVKHRRLFKERRLIGKNKIKRREVMFEHFLTLYISQLDEKKEEMKKVMEETLKPLIEEKHSTNFEDVLLLYTTGSNFNNKLLEKLKKKDWAVYSLISDIVYMSSNWKNDSEYLFYHLHTKLKIGEFVTRNVNEKDCDEPQFENYGRGGILSILARNGVSHSPEARAKISKEESLRTDALKFLNFLRMAMKNNNWNASKTLEVIRYIKDSEIYSNDEIKALRYISDRSLSRMKAESIKKMYRNHENKQCKSKRFSKKLSLCDWSRYLYSMVVEFIHFNTIDEDLMNEFLDFAKILPRWQGEAKDIYDSIVFLFKTNNSAVSDGSIKTSATPTKSHKVKEENFVLEPTKRVKFHPKPTKGIPIETKRKKSKNRWLKISPMRNNAQRKEETPSIKNDSRKIQNPTLLKTKKRLMLLSLTQQVEAYLKYSEKLAFIREVELQLEKSLSLAIPISIHISSALKLKEEHPKDIIIGLIDILGIYNDFKISTKDNREYLLELEGANYKDQIKKAHAKIMQDTFGKPVRRSNKEVVKETCESFKFPKSVNTLCDEIEDLYSTFEDTNAQMLEYLKSSNRLYSKFPHNIKDEILQLNKELNMINKQLDGTSFQEGDEEKLKTRKKKNFMKRVALIGVIAFHTFQRYPRVPQMFTFLLIALKKENLGMVAQMRTGEGKTILIKMIAAYFVSLGKKVDVVSTSSELVQNTFKDKSERTEKFFQAFGFSVKNALSIEASSKSKETYGAQVLYGTAEIFQADYLRERFYGQNTRFGRKFDILIIDEADSMLFDQRNSVLRLSSPTPLMDELLLFQSIIWLYVKCMVDTLNSIIGPYGENDMVKLVNKNAAKFFQNAMREDRIEFDKQEIKIPPHLMQFCIRQREVWTQSALIAYLIFKENEHYHVDRENGKIYPIDFDNTGVLLKTTTWENGLSQFIQMKEGLRLIPESISTNYFSKRGFFKLYKKGIIGFTGTLGTAETASDTSNNVKTTRDFIADEYELATFIIPSHQELKIAANSASIYSCKEYEPRVYQDVKSWYSAIVASCRMEATTGRSVLVICKFISDVKQLNKRLDKSQSANAAVKMVIQYTGTEQVGLDKQIRSGTIILATNIAGRGTDLKTTKSVERAGGLHVCVTFLPDNQRVELQNVGRTARSGKKGSAQLIVFNPEGLNIAKIKQKRTEKQNEIQRMANYDIKLIDDRDKIFEQFCEFQLELYKRCHTPSDYEILQAFQREAGQNELIRIMKKIVNTEEEKHLIESENGDILGKWAEMFIRKCSLKEEGDEHVESEIKRNFDKDIVNSEMKLSHQDIYALQERWGFSLKNCTKKVSVKDLTASDVENVRDSDLENSGLNRKEANEHLVHLQNLEAEFEEFMKENTIEHKETNNGVYITNKGIEMLEKGRFQQAQELFQTAIDTTETFSLFPRYYKGMTIVKGATEVSERDAAIKLFQESIILIKKVYIPRLLMLNSIVMQSRGSQGESSSSSSSHTTSKIGILMRFSEHLEESIDALRKMEPPYEVHVHQATRYFLDRLKVFKKESNSIKRDETADRCTRALNEARVNGLSLIYEIHQSEKFKKSSESCAQALIGISRITSGTAATTFLSAKRKEKIGADTIKGAAKSSLKAVTEKEFQTDVIKEWNLESTVSSVFRIGVLIKNHALECANIQRIGENDSEDIETLNKTLKKHSKGLMNKLFGSFQAKYISRMFKFTSNYLNGVLKTRIYEINLKNKLLCKYMSYDFLTAQEQVDGFFTYFKKFLTIGTPVEKPNLKNCVIHELRALRYKFDYISSESWKILYSLKDKSLTTTETLFQEEANNKILEKYSNDYSKFLRDCMLSIEKKKASELKNMKSALKSYVKAKNKREKQKIRLQGKQNEKKFQESEEMKNLKRYFDEFENKISSTKSKEDILSLLNELNAFSENQDIVFSLQNNVTLSNSGN